MATTAVLYLLNNTADDPSSRIVITPGAYDGPGGVQRSTDLTFYGNGAPNWGERFNENFYHLLENFAVAEKGGLDGVPNPDTAQVPTPKDENDLGGIGLGVNSPIEGQTWYNRSRGLMYLYTGVESGGVGVPRWKPLSNLLVLDDAATRDAYFDGSERDGEIVYNRDTLSIEVFDQGAWTSTSNFLRLDGSNSPMTGFLTLVNVTPTDTWHAVPKGYVDALVSGVGGGIVTDHGGLTGLADDDHLQYLNRSGVRSMTGILNMGGNRISSVGNATTGTDALNRDTADARYVNTSGDTMSGLLSMGGNFITNLLNPVNAQDAATKAYVDGLTGTSMSASYPLGTNGGWLDIPTSVGTLIIQWGQSNYTGVGEAGWPATATFPKAFPTVCLQVIAGCRGRNIGGGDYTQQVHQMCVRNETITTTGFSVYATEDDSKNQDFAIAYIAIGY